MRSVILAFRQKWLAGYLIDKVWLSHSISIMIVGATFLNKSLLCLKWLRRKLQFAVLRWFTKVGAYQSPRVFIFIYLKTHDIECFTSTVTSFELRNLCATAERHRMFTCLTHARMSVVKTLLTQAKFPVRHRNKKQSSGWRNPAELPATTLSYHEKFTLLVGGLF